MEADFGLEIHASFDPLGFRFGAEVFGPEPELRRLDAIRPSLRDPLCDGPDPVYAIAMDVGLFRHRAELERRNLLFGVVAYAAGRLGDEPVRSQGHVHKLSRNSGWSPPEIFEIWQGRALIYMQESASDDPGRCFAVDARPGDRVVTPPGWAHAVISADALQPVVFGAWCDRDYGFVYDEVRSHHGLAWFPILDEAGAITWMRNDRYLERDLEVRPARRYPEMGLDSGTPLYRHLEQKPAGVQWVSQPDLLRDLWPRFEP
jgi:glucose-6-phosphate isomerase, archaeal